MKTKVLLTLLLCANIFCATAQLTYDEEGKLEYDETWKRTRVGTAAAADLAEVSGLTCSRVTPGYLWAQGDDSNKVRALTPEGKYVSTIKLANSYRDWEDICGGVYNDTNYVFVGIFGDNSRSYKDKYYIYYFKEPEIVEGEIKVDVDTIHFGYPDGEGHNAETLMYDNVEQVLYIVDKSTLQLGISQTSQSSLTYLLKSSSVTSAILASNSSESRALRISIEYNALLNFLSGCLLS